ncbi:MAG TPA: DNRLRE domain-containing protein, partial [Humisphaera sp.]
TADLAPGDVDYYRAGTVSTDGTMTATLSFAAADGDLYLVAFDAAGNEVARSDTPGDTEALSFRTGELADFTFGVFGKDGASNGRYKLDVNWTEANAPTAAFYPALGFGPQSMMTVVFDEPVYNVDLSDFELTRDGQPVDMAAAGARLGWTTGGTRIEDLSAATGAGGRYLLRLKAAGSGIVDVYGNPLTADAVVGWYNELSPMPQVAIVADRDAGVRGGADAGSNFGSAPQMAVAAATGTSPAAAAYLSFDLSGVRRDLPLADAYVRVFVRAADDVNDAYLTVGLAASDAWTEGGLTFSNRPAVDTSEGGQAGVSGTAGQWVSLDVTRYLNARLAAGATRASFAIVVPGGVPGSAVVDSREAGETAPRLLVRNAIPRTAVEFDTEQLVVPEGGTATVGVRLNKPIDSPVYAQFGVGSPTESDLSCPPTIVTFTPANWNVFQPIVVSAAQDADTDHGYATMSAVLPQAGVLIGTLPVREQDDDLATVEMVVRAAADATVEDGTTRAITPSTELVVRKGTTAGANREAYLRFDVTGLPAASSLSRVKVRLYGRSSTGAAVPVGLFPVTSTSWGETTVTWSTKPATSATPVAAATVSGTAGAWYEFDVTDYVKARKAAGATAVSFALKGTAATTAYATFASDEATANRPELRAARLVAATPQSIVVSASSLTLGEGKTATFTVRLATKPKANVTVTIGRAAGDASVSAAPASITFTPLDWDKPKTVTVAAAQDADRLDAKATIAVAADGLLARKVTVTATDDDKSTAPRSLAATAAANVRDGTYAGTNFGTSTELTVKRSTTAGSSRVSVLKFDLSALPAVTSGKLRLYGRLAATGAGATVNVYGSAATGWSETGVNWSNQPAAGALLATLRVTSTSNAWYEVDLTAYLAAERAAGRTTVTLVLKSASAAEPQVTFASDEASANRPVLMAGG